MAIQIFRAGKRPDANGVVVDFSESTLSLVAQSYDPAIHEAPIVLGHPTHDAPAYGWAAALSVEGGILLAEPQQLEPEFAEAVEAGRYKKISASFYLPGSAHHPIANSKVPYLRHIGFLGAMPPVVKGLQDARFCELSDSEDGVFYCECEASTLPFWKVGAALRTISDSFQAQRDMALVEQGLEAADRMFGLYQIQSLRDVAETLMNWQTEPPTPLLNSYGEPMATEQEMVAREKAIAAREQELAHAEAVNFCERLIAQGRGEIAGIREEAIALLTQSSYAQSVEFGEWGENCAGELLKTILKAFPKTVEFGEFAGTETSPNPTMLDTAELARRAKQMVSSKASKGEVLEYSEAVRQVAKQAGIQEP
jgi:hypothetical protein